MVRDVVADVVVCVGFVGEEDGDCVCHGWLGCWIENFGGGIGMASQNNRGVDEPKNSLFGRGNL